MKVHKGNATSRGKNANIITCKTTSLKGVGGASGVLLPG